MFSTSIIIPTYNAEKTLDLQLESLANQTEHDPFEVLVVNNASTDRTVEVAERWASKLNLKVIDAREHKGVSYARNKGVAHAQGEKLIFIDADDALLPEYIGYMQRSLDEFPVVLGGFVPVEDSSFSEGLEGALKEVSDRTQEYASPIYEEDSKWPILPGCSFGILRSDMVKVGGFDLSMEPGAEDNDLAFRLLRAGYSLPVQRSTTIAYRVNNQQRPLKVYFLRAQSVALLAQRYQAWQDGPFSGGRHPLVTFSGTLLAGVKRLATELTHLRPWLIRLATDAGLVIGWLRYRLLKRIPAPRLGVGMN